MPAGRTCFKFLADIRDFSSRLSRESHFFEGAFQPEVELIILLWSSSSVKLAVERLSYFTCNRFSWLPTLSLQNRSEIKLTALRKPISSKLTFYSFIGATKKVS